MRTIEEVINYVKEYKENLKNLTNFGYEQDTLTNVLSFIESDPPCKHPNTIVYSRADMWAVMLSLVLAKRGITPNDIPIGKQAVFCPDCGVKIERKG